MNRISTASSYLSVMANLNLAQLRQIEAGDQVSSQKKADDLKGYARHAETLTSMRSVQTRVQGFMQQSEMLSDRFTTQDTAMVQLSDLAAAARQSITDALASGRADTLMQELRGFFGDAVAALNTRSQGKFLFAGGQVNTLPVTATSMSDLIPGPVSGLFKNDQFRITTQLDENSSIDGNFLADELGTDLFNVFAAIQTFETTPGSGPLTGELNPTQVAFLQSQLAPFDQVHEDLTNKAALNGAFHKRVEDTFRDLKSRDATLENMIGGVTDVDVAEAISRLQQAQIAVQASAQVFSTLQSSSLVNLLSR